MIAASLPLSAQITINNFAGGAVRSAVPAQNVYLDGNSGLTWDANGNVVFCDQTNQAIRRVDTNGTMETIAGMGVPGFTGDGGPATSALINKPLAPHYDAAGNLYFLDSGNLRIRRIDAKGIITTVAGDGIGFITGMDSTGPASQRSLDYVSDMQVSSAGNVYFLEPNQNRIRVVTPAGQVSIFFTLAQGEFSSLMTIDGAGNLYVSERNTVYYAALLRLAPDGTATILYQQSTTGENFASVPSVIADPAGNLYIVTAVGEADAIARFNPANGATTIIAGGGQPPAFGYVSSPDGPALPSVIYPSNLAFDARGNIAFYDTFTPLACCNVRIEIREVTAASQLVTLAGGSGQFVPDGTALGNIWFEGLTSIAFSQTGDLYVAEARSCKIHEISAAGAFTTFAGNGTCAYPTPAPNAQNAAITPPVSIAIDQQNRVWVADGYVNLYNIAPDGTVSQTIKTPVIGGTGKIAVDAKGRVDVVGLDSLYRVMPDFTYQQLTPTPSAGAGGWMLTAIGADASGTVYVAANQNIYTVNDDGTLSLVYPNQGNPPSLAVGPDERIWEGGSGTVGVVGPAGTAILGDTRAVTPGDGGPVNSAGIDQSGSLAFSPAGDLYFTDGNRIRRLTGIGNATPAPSITAGGVVNSASYAGGSLSPGELVSIFGSNFGAAALETAGIENNYYPIGLGRTQVLFDGYPGTIIAVTPTQINAIVPYPATFNTTASVQVEVDSALSLPVSLPVAAAAPGLSTASQTGSGEAAIVNSDGSINSASNPAARGSIVSLYGTGLGPVYLPIEINGYYPVLPDGALTISTPYPMPQGPVTVSIGGQPATVPYAGAAPFLVNGVFQINVQIPSGIAPGNAAIAVSVAGIVSKQQVTVAVK